jgi:tubby-related protein 1
MFLNDEDFGDDIDFKKASPSPFRPKNGESKNDGNLAMVDIDSPEHVYGTAGGIASPSSSRARMLAQQRDIQLKKRQSALLGGGMVRSSKDSSLDRNDGLRASGDAQFTPAVRQFSMPKAVQNSSADYQAEKSEFSRPAKPRTTRIQERYRDAGDEEDDDFEPRRPTRREPKSHHRYVDGDEEDDRDMYERRRPAPERRAQEENYEDSYRSSRRGKERRSIRRDYQDDDEDWDADDKRSGASLVASSSHKSPARKGKDRSREAQSSSPAPPPFELDMSDMRKFLLTPVPKEAGIVKCCIRRTKGPLSNPVYSLYAKDGETFLMTSKKRANNKKSNYLISMQEGDLNRDGRNYLGKLRKSNYMGTEFQVFDDGANPKDTDDPDAPTSSKARKELSAILYASNMMIGSRGPRKMQVAVPRVDAHGVPIDNLPDGTEADYLGKMKERNFREMVYMINKPPRWNEQVGAYVLNFAGRVTMASVKNFQLVSPDNQNDVLLQFGRVGKDDFTMDFQWPLSPFQSFAITLSSFDSKIACD